MDRRIYFFLVTIADNIAAPSMDNAMAMASCTTKFIKRVGSDSQDNAYQKIVVEFGSRIVNYQLLSSFNMREMVELFKMELAPFKVAAALRYAVAQHRDLMGDMEIKTLNSVSNRIETDELNKFIKRQVCQQ